MEYCVLKFLKSREQILKYKTWNRLDSVLGSLFLSKSHVLKKNSPWRSRKNKLKDTLRELNDSDCRQINYTFGSD